MKKIFVLDTNVLLHNATSIELNGCDVATKPFSAKTFDLPG